jgi:hypothetical protein
VIIRIRRPKTVGEIAGMISLGGDAVASKKAAQRMRPNVRDTLSFDSDFDLVWGPNRLH